MGDMCNTKDMEIAYRILFVKSLGKEALGKRGRK
jgi:hypothetical protein